MDEYVAAIPVSNVTILRVGGVTRAEADQARDSGLDVDGRGYWLFPANASKLKQPRR
jgi:2-keto-3-deoxy-6-phosphogluconate aldolase